MSFESHDHDVPDELPADLAALGEQLQADALRLGNVYPACKAPVALKDPSIGRARLLPSRGAVTIVASIAATLLLAVGMFWLLNPPMPEPAATRSNELTNHDTHSPSIQPVSFRPAMAEVNGPELEGLLDLLDEQGETAAAISF